MTDPGAAPLSFAAYAMATEFTLLVAHDEPIYARQAAAAAFRELDLIEERLSRTITHSDIRRLQSAAPGQPVLVSPDTLDCLSIALRIERATGGAFDVGYRTRPRRPASELLRIDPDTHSITPLHFGVQIDLGGIGKGFALDRMAALLEEWDLAHACLAASTSTYLALDPPPARPGWHTGFGAGRARVELDLSRQALSASGTGVQGAHIVDPRTGRSARRARAWALAPTGAEADALSTAFLLMPEHAIRALLRRDARLRGWIQETEDRPPVALDLGDVER